MNRRSVLALLAVLAAETAGWAQTPVAAGNLVVLQVGTGGAALSDMATAVSLLEINPGTGTTVRTIGVSSAGAAALTLPGNTRTEGVLTLSQAGGLITFGGYRKNAGGADPRGDAAAATNRVIGVLDTATGRVNTNLAVTDAHSGGLIRAVATADGTSFYTSGSGVDPTGGVRYVGAAPGATPTGATSQGVNRPNSSSPDTRQVQVAGGNLFVSSGAGNPGQGVFQVGTGLPAGGDQAYTTAASAPGQPTSFYLTRLGTGPTFNNTGFDTLYTADGAGVAKYTFDGANFVPDGTVAGSGVSNIAGVTTGSSVTLFGTNGANVLRLTDSAGFDGTLAGGFTTIATAGPDTLFRGIAVAPVPEPAAVLAAAAAGLGLARRRLRMASAGRREGRG